MVLISRNILVIVDKVLLHYKILLPIKLVKKCWPVKKLAIYLRVRGGFKL